MNKSILRKRDLKVISDLRYCFTKWIFHQYNMYTKVIISTYMNAVWGLQKVLVCSARPTMWQSSQQLNVGHSDMFHYNWCPNLL